MTRPTAFDDTAKAMFDVMPDDMVALVIIGKRHPSGVGVELCTYCTGSPEAGAAMLQNVYERQIAGKPLPRERIGRKAPRQ